jgi:hypothetical protein
MVNPNKILRHPIAYVVPVLGNDEFQWHGFYMLHDDEEYLPVFCADA